MQALTRYDRCLTSAPTGQILGFEVLVHRSRYGATMNMTPATSKDATAKLVRGVSLECNEKICIFLAVNGSI